MEDKKDSSANLMKTQSNGDLDRSTPGCGFGPWRPRCLQIFAKPIVFLILLNIYCIVEGTIVSGLTSVVLSTLETRYKFSSIQLGMLSSAFDITVLVTVVFISYFGGTHKAKWLGAGVFIQGIGALLFASPQFITGDYDVGKDANLTLEECRDQNDFSPECRKSDNIYVLFIFANMVIAVGAAPLFTIGTSYIDDIVHPKRAPIWLGIFYTWAVVGPALGFGIGGGFLIVYVDPWRETTLEESDPGWVGAWWIGYVICGVISLLISIPFFMFPEKYPDTDFIQEERIKQMSIQYKREISKEDLNIKFHLKELPRQVFDLLANVPFMCITISFALQALVVSGLVAFAPKYVQTQFSLSASAASLISGAVAIPSAGVGIMLGALLVFLRKPMTKTLTLYFAVLNLIAAFFLAAFFLRCSTHDIAGVTVPYPNSTLFDDQTLNATCNSHCDCKSTIFEPVCSDGITYFSPCRAGCDEYFLNGDRNVRPGLRYATANNEDGARVDVYASGFWIGAKI
ncbi:solute carrier organic anion transporter family member 4C1-like isoform X2 [Dysidea avara]|uniref:solute carrier organic anion transporter family member 4C1-like isoform X2 n=1 Tax=Dysidea avara TaxID=196820 RepID=UPI00332C1E50